MSYRLFQGVIQQMKESVGAVIGVVDDNGVIVACSDLSRIGENCGFNVTTLFGTPATKLINSVTYRAFESAGQSLYAVFIESSDPSAASHCEIIAIALSNLKQYYDEKYDRGNFIKNVMTNNILPSDVYLRARDLRFDNETRRAVLLIRCSARSSIDVYDKIVSLFPDTGKDFVININENDIALVKDISSVNDTKELEALAHSIVDTIDAEFHTHSLVGIGTAVTAIKDIAASFKEAQISLEVGKVFDTEKVVVSYDNLGIARLIYQLPTSLCEMFLKEVFKRGSIDSLDHETLFTIQKFFDNNLNVSETSRKLFVHRNTLVYRLEKIRKLTGLDLREFDDAIVFKVALMVKKYLDASPVKY